jgi:hypothetical protein
MALVGTGDKDWTPEHQLRLEDVAERARAYLNAQPGLAPVSTQNVRLAGLSELEADDEERSGYTRWLEASDMREAAKLLRRTPHPRPIPAAEMLPEAEDCDAQGRCWWWDKTVQYWILRCADDAEALEFWSFWLPANALPLPLSEAK